MQRGAETGDEIDPRQPAQGFGQALQPLAADRPGMQLLAGDHLIGGAGRHQRAVGDVGQAVAAFGFVHVVRGDEYRDAGGGKTVDFFPEVAPRLGVHAGGGFVEQ